MTIRDSGVDCLGMMEIFVQRLFDDVLLDGEESDPIRLLSGPFGGFLEAFGLHHILGDGWVV